MDGYQQNQGSRIPQFALVVVTYELVNDTWVATVGHSFYGDTEEEASRVLEAHKKTDRFFAASFTGEFNGIVLRNSKPQLFQTGVPTP